MHKLPIISRSLKNAKRKACLTVLTLGTLITYSFSATQPVGIDAQYSSSVSSQINSLESQMAQLTQKISSEQSQISSLGGQIKLSQSQISQLQDVVSQKEQLIADNQTQINLLNQSIADEKNQITALTEQISKEQSVFNAQLKSNYENSYTNAFFFALGSHNISDTFASLEYITDSQNASSKLIGDLKVNQLELNQKLNDLSVQDTDLTNAQSQLENEKSSLQQQQQQLQAQLASDTAVNNQIQHQLSADQAQYQDLVNAINNLQVGSYSGSWNCGVTPPPGDSWYYNQQCGSRYLKGMYGTSINMTYGCLITDIAMVVTKSYGPYYNPATIASRTWFSGNYMMAWPSPLPMSPVDLGYRNISAINKYTNEGVPVIVYLAAPAGEHWVVLYGTLGNGDYIMNDPWYGPALRFQGTGGGPHAYYSDSEMGEAFVMQ